MRKLIAIVVLLCGATGAWATADDLEPLCSPDGQHVITFTPNKGFKLDGKPLPQSVSADIDDSGYVLIWKGVTFRDTYCQ